jgi:hypothetical protein
VTSGASLDDLPLFASGEELGRAVVGPKRAKDWARTVLPRLATMPGWPPYDNAHGGYYSPAVKRYYDERHRITGATNVISLNDRGEEDPEAWRRRPRASGHRRQG